MGERTDARIVPIITRKNTEASADLTPPKKAAVEE